MSLSIVFITVVITPNSKAATNYRFIVDSPGDRANINWKYTKINQSLIGKLVNESYCSSEYLSYKTNDYIRWDIKSEGELHSAWKIFIKEYNSVNYIYNKYYINVLKDPKKFYLIWTSNNESFYTKKLIPFNIRNYLTSFSQYLFSENISSYQVTYSSIHEDFRNDSTHGHSKFNYNSYGILKKFEMFYDNQTALEITLDKYDILYPPCNCGPYPYPFFYIFALIVFIAIIVVNSIIYLGVRESYLQKLISYKDREVKD
jgi:hypothetical protein